MGHQEEIISEAATAALERTLRIRALNDGLRTLHVGGELFLTQGVANLPYARRIAVMNAIATFDAFTEDNDPYGEHDCATLTVDGVEVIFKIDYYDRTREYGSSDPSDPSVTRRVLTILLTSEY